MSTVELERPSPTGTATRHALPARLPALRPVEPACGPEPFDDLAAVFPSRRLGAAATALTRRRALGFDARASATAWLIGEGLEPLDDDQRRAVIQGWNAYRDHGPRLVGDGGCDVRLGRSAVEMTELAALLAWLPLTHRELAVFEGGLFADAPARAIALLVRPPTIWPLEEALLAERRIPRGPRFSPERFAAVERHAYDRIGVEQLTRLREAVARIAAQLPVGELTVASETIARGCALVAGDEAREIAVVARQLARYASSALVEIHARTAG